MRLPSMGRRPSSHLSSVGEPFGPCIAVRSPLSNSWGKGAFCWRQSKLDSNGSTFAQSRNLAAAKARQEAAGHVLILLDCEDDCPARFGPRLLDQARAVAPDVNIIVALAHREYETWFMAAAESLRGVEGMSGAVGRPADPEATRDAKGWLGRHLPHGYDPISHQLAFTHAFDLDAARTIASFDRLYRKIASLLPVA